MKGYLLLKDGTRISGIIRGEPGTAVGWLTANTSVVGFQEMATDPAYRGSILAFTYPEIGNVGFAESFNESGAVQAAGLVVKVLSGYKSHYLTSDSFESLLLRHKVPCLTEIDTRGLAIHLRESGEMPAAIVPADADQDDVMHSLISMERPGFKPSLSTEPLAAGTGVKLAVIDLGIRRSLGDQLSRCSQPIVFPYDAEPEKIIKSGVAGVLVSDGPGGSLPPTETVGLIRALLGRKPLLACGVGHVVLGMALGCRPSFLKRGHHGANYPVRNVLNGTAEVTRQRHTLVLDRDSVDDGKDAELTWENINDKTVEGIRAKDGSAIGFQSQLEAPGIGRVNEHILEFVNGLQ